MAPEYLGSLKKILPAVLALGAVAIFSWWLLGRHAPSTYDDLDDFARCLTEKKITMYGAAWCQHCRNEKDRFGPAFRFVSYVECPDSPKLCAEPGIGGYPTWVFPNGKKLEGEQGLEKLAQESGCELKNSSSQFRL